MRFLVKIIPLVCGVLCLGLLAACTAVGPMQQGAMPMPEPGKITVLDARARPSPMMEGNGAAYMTILNGLDRPVRLTQANSPVAGVVELHETVNDNGVLRMVPQPDGFEAPAGGSVELKPGGKHVMLIGLVAPLEAGKSIELTLSFDTGDVMTLTVPVVEMDEAMPMNMEHDEGQTPAADMP